MGTAPADFRLDPFQKGHPSEWCFASVWFQNTKHMVFGASKNCCGLTSRCRSFLWSLEPFVWSRVAKHPNLEQVARLRLWPDEAP